MRGRMIGKEAKREKTSPVPWSWSPSLLMLSISGTRPTRSTVSRLTPLLDSLPTRVIEKSSQIIVRVGVH